MDEKPGVQREITRLENEVYDWQIKIYELHMQILDEEEKLAKTQREAITRDIKGLYTRFELTIYLRLLISFILTCISCKKESLS